MTKEFIYQPRYNNSWGLVIGINSYIKAPPLAYAVNDAKAFSSMLIEKFSFSKKNVIFLSDNKATKEKIISAYLNFTKEHISPDDRLIVFFAGHGYTKTGSRGEVGYLVPVNGFPEDLSTLIRWDEFTRNAELIAAKHILFIMDACYGGLALLRHLPSGSMRFLKDMLQRYSRQVLTAGKANEVVADSGGPRPEHSIFTGYLLEALTGKAATPDGVITANTLMAYVYNGVAKDYQSMQTPHYGFIDGDGDLIFNPLAFDELSKQPEIDKDILIEIPPTSYESPNEQITDIADLAKEYLSDSRYRIKLDDLVVREVRRLLSRIGPDFFPIQGAEITHSGFAERLKLYEECIEDLQKIIILLGKWGGTEHKSILEKTLTRTAELNQGETGLAAWIGLRWYPILLLLYSGGIATLSANNYNNLATILTIKVTPSIIGEVAKEIIISAVTGINKVQQFDLFKTLPGHERHYVPRSEYMFKVLQPILDDLLFLGRSYEQLFDKFEIFLALVFADLKYDEKKYIWGPPGRFAWKFRSKINDGDLFLELREEADRLGNEWPPLQAGLFKGSYERFTEVATEYEKIMHSLKWY